MAGKALVFLVLEFGALCGVPMDPNKIEELMQVMKRNATVSERQKDGDGDDGAGGSDRLPDGDGDSRGAA